MRYGLGRLIQELLGPGGGLAGALGVSALPGELDLLLEPGVAGAQEALAADRVVRRVGGDEPFEGGLGTQRGDEHVDAVPDGVGRLVGQGLDLLRVSAVGGGVERRVLARMRPLATGVIAGVRAALLLGL